MSREVRSVAGRYDVGVGLPSSKVKGSSLTDTDNDDAVVAVSVCLFFLDGGPMPPPRPPLDAGGERARTRPWSIPPRAWLDAEGRFLPQPPLRLRFNLAVEVPPLGGTALVEELAREGLPKKLDLGLGLDLG